MTSTTRLHITPFNAELLPLVLPAPIRDVATDISFHNVLTFPENNYGYVTLPAMEADKIKKKLNGSILKSRKFRVEAAHPQKLQRDEEDGINIMSSDRPSASNKSKKRKVTDNMLDGYELPSDRKVKRGWTESANDKTERRKKEKRAKSKDEKKAKSQSKSKYTEKAECLFRTKVPPNRTSPPDGKSKKQSKKNSKLSEESVVHEFSKTMTYPTFLRSDDGGKPLTSTFDQDKGWVDESGGVKEPASGRIRKDKYRPGQVAGHKERPKKVTGKPYLKNEETREAETKNQVTKSKAAESTDSEDWTSSSGSSSEGKSTDSESDESGSSSSSDESEVSDITSLRKEQQQIPTRGSSREEKQGSNTDIRSLPKGRSPEEDCEQQPTEIHPLEALFKKPSDENPSSEPTAQFSFFGQADAESEEEMPTHVAPLTPFTKRDLQDRGLRSAAPTPDTSQVTRTINWNPPEHLDKFSKSGADSKEESEFAKWFWENRGDNNRAWKKRRRDAAKEQRQRENRRKGLKGKS
ncbi:uncharacterized protein BJX67DRAFT_346089 [Aspergillus lucknowensis]|uniref:Suppressor protein SRP40 n=1 Tax=Aspergillus lucknowensis TaxID=176173 RepID=A0ABR4LZH3_9EURO